MTLDKPQVRRTRKPLIRILTIVSVFSFLASSGGAAFRLINRPQPNSDNDSTEEVSRLEMLAARERGYQLVLQREPKNRLALEELANIQLELGNIEDSTTTLTQLVELYPDQLGYRELLNQVTHKKE
ncbi:MAG: tetratricopeptide repeat protein [Cyanothece sp. SIO1E1]|nr:tetratricopeptide repeat protein [Cyanothece sp. SIO1E1]